MMGMFGGGGSRRSRRAISRSCGSCWASRCDGDEIVWQDFNPEPKLGDIYREWIFIDEGLADGGHGTPHPFDPDDRDFGRHEAGAVLLAGSFRPADNSKLDFKQLAVTGRNSGTISYQDIEMSLRAGGMMGVRRNTTHEPYIIAAHVKGKVTADAATVSCRKTKTSDASSGRDRQSRRQRDAQADATARTQRREEDAPRTMRWPARSRRRRRSTSCSSPTSIGSRRSSSGFAKWARTPDSVIDFKFQNVPFVLNILDSLAGDDRFIDLRKRTRSHRILTKVEEATEEHRKSSLDEQTKFVTDAQQQIDAAQEEFRKKMAELEKPHGSRPARA